MTDDMTPEERIRILLSAAKLSREMKQLSAAMELEALAEEIRREQGDAEG
jgi:hypothetical protein